MKKTKEPELLKLDLGCGMNKQPGYKGVDIAKVDGVDFVFDLRKKKWPWKDNSVDEVFSSHFFEHLTGPERMTFMDELYRVMKPGAKAQFITPYWSSMRSVQDPTHAWPPVCEASFLYFNKNWREANKLGFYNIKSDFDFTYGYNLAPDVANKNEEARMFAATKYVNSVSDIFITLTSNKKQA